MFLINHNKTDCRKPQLQMRLQVCILCDSRWVPRWAGKEQNAAGGHGSHTPRHSEHVMTKKNTMKFSFHTQVWLLCIRDDDVCHSLPGDDAHTKGPTKRPTRQTPHRTINLSFLNHIELHQQPQPTLTLRWQSTSVPVLVRCKLKHPQYLFRVRLCLLIWLKAIPTFYAAFNLPWCKPG